MAEYCTEAFWDGKWQTGDGKTFKVFDPSNGEQLADVVDCSKVEAELAVAAASKAFLSWSKTTVKERASLLLKIRDVLLRSKEEMAVILTKENGKPKAEALGEIGFAASFFEWFAEEGRRQYGDTIPSNVPDKRFITSRQPAGVAAMITPWNFPIGMIARKVAAAVAAGCTCVVKPAEDTPLTALRFVKVCIDAGVPEGVVNVIPCSRSNVEEVGSFLVTSKDVSVLSFTGSTKVGKLLYSQCGNTLKKLALELGGNAPFIIFPSANLEVALRGIMSSKFRNTGQTCVTANRIFVHESLHDEFVERFAALMDSDLKVGNGVEAGVNQGPIINKKQLTRLTNIVKESIKMGAKVIRGGEGLTGLFYSPTLLTNVSKEMPVAKEEIFGPVAAVLKFRTEEEVIASANDTEGGLAGYFYSTDYAQCWRVSEALEYGMIGVNDGQVSTCEIPFGGMKESGFGKEGSRHGLDEYSHVKFISFGNVK